MANNNRSSLPVKRIVKATAGPFASLQLPVTISNETYKAVIDVGLPTSLVSTALWQKFNSPLFPAPDNEVTQRVMRRTNLQLMGYTQFQLQVKDTILDLDKVLVYDFDEPEIFLNISAVAALGLVIDFQEGSFALRQKESIKVCWTEETLLFPNDRLVNRPNLGVASSISAGFETDGFPHPNVPIGNYGSPPYGGQDVNMMQVSPMGLGSFVPMVPGPRPVFQVPQPMFPLPGPGNIIQGLQPMGPSADFQWFPKAATQGPQRKVQKNFYGKKDVDKKNLVNVPIYDNNNLATVNIEKKVDLKPVRFGASKMPSTSNQNSSRITQNPSKNNQNPSKNNPNYSKNHPSPSKNNSSSSKNNPNPPRSSPNVSKNKSRNNSTRGSLPPKPPSNFDLGKYSSGDRYAQNDSNSSGNKSTSKNTTRGTRPSSHSESNKVERKSNTNNSPKRAHSPLPNESDRKKLKIQCTNCGAGNHPVSNCHKPLVMKCLACGQQGHGRHDCPTLVRASEFSKTNSSPKASTSNESETTPSEPQITETSTAPEIQTSENQKSERLTASEIEPSETSEVPAASEIPASSSLVPSTTPLVKKKIIKKVMVKKVVKQLVKRTGVPPGNVENSSPSGNKIIRKVVKKPLVQPSSAETKSTDTTVENTPNKTDNSVEISKPETTKPTEATKPSPTPKPIKAPVKPVEATKPSQKPTENTKPSVEPAKPSAESIKPSAKPKEPTKPSTPKETIASSPQATTPDVKPIATTDTFKKPTDADELFKKPEVDLVIHKPITRVMTRKAIKLNILSPPKAVGKAASAEKSDGITVESSPKKED